MEDLGLRLEVAHEIVDALQRLGDGNLRDLLAVKADSVVVVHSATEGQDDVVGLLDLLGRELVLNAAGTLGLHVDLVAQLGALGLDGLGHHVGVSDAGRTVGHCHDGLCHALLLSLCFR